MNSQLTTEPRPSAQATGYKWDLWCIGDLFIQISEERAKIPDLRFEFNPNKINPAALIWFKRWIANCTGVRITRLDIAVDYIGECDLRKSQVLCNDQPRTGNAYWDDKGDYVTLYVGAKRSKTQIRMYDKGIKEKTHPRGIWWRIEAQMREQKDWTTNPFTHITVLTGVDDEGLEGEKLLALHYLFDFPNRALGLFKSPTTKSKYRKWLKESAIQLNPQPSQVFENEKATIVSAIAALVKGEDLFGVINPIVPRVANN